LTACDKVDSSVPQAFGHITIIAPARWLGIPAVATVSVCSDQPAVTYAPHLTAHLLFVSEHHKVPERPSGPLA